ncbi:carotenoid biosynthesis protein [Planomicrobium okeanokoites]|uniref:carotenoid biosynthesis protein n=1 Tax=Planomicrobium okeanokoites TaxID=244 RepID=UPI0009FBCD1A|nr:carotenoid biosynthesis protein [Planomicrobium okeanokoites]
MFLKWEEGIYRLFLIWYTIGIILLAFDLLPSWLEWANAVFLILAGTIGFLYFLKRFGKPAGITIGLIIFFATFIVEGAGANSGFLFGSYDYTDHFAPNLFGVPIAIGFAWLMVVATSHVLARWIFPNSTFAYAVTGGIGAVIMDLIIDPVAYRIKTYWIWEDTGWYYGIPWTNFLGWFIVSFVLHLLIDWMMRRKSMVIANDTAERRLVLLYLLMIAMFAMLGALGGLWLAVAASTIPAVLLVVLAWKRRPL